MFQKEVIDRIISHEKSKNYGILSILPELFYKKKVLLKIPNTSFYPSPKIDSGIILFEKKTSQFNINNISKFINLIKIIFSKRRKTINNNIKFFSNYDKINISQDIIKKVIDKQGFGNKRAEEMSIDNLVNIYKEI